MATGATATDSSQLYGRAQSSYGAWPGTATSLSPQMAIRDACSGEHGAFRLKSHRKQDVTQENRVMLIATAKGDGELWRIRCDPPDARLRVDVCSYYPPSGSHPITLSQLSHGVGLRKDGVKREEHYTRAKEVVAGWGKTDHQVALHADLLGCNASALQLGNAHAWGCYSAGLLGDRNFVNPTGPLST